MNTFQLKVVSPDGPVFEGDVEQLIVRTTTGDMGIQAGHTNCVAPLGMGLATITVDGRKRNAACIGGMVSVIGGHVNLVATTFEWAENIDTARAEASYQRAQTILSRKDASETELRLAEARLRRALVRKGVASMK